MDIFSRIKSARNYLSWWLNADHKAIKSLSKMYDIVGEFLMHDGVGIRKMDFKPDGNLIGGDYVPNSLVLVQYNNQNPDIMRFVGRSLMPVFKHADVKVIQFQSPITPKNSVSIGKLAEMKAKFDPKINQLVRIIFNDDHRISYKLLRPKDPVIMGGFYVILSGKRGARASNAGYSDSVLPMVCDMVELPGLRKYQKNLYRDQKKVKVDEYFYPVSFRRTLTSIPIGGIPLSSNTYVNYDPTTIQIGSEESAEMSHSEN